MPLTVVPTAYGRPASEALRDVLAVVKADDPLAPVTVVVPTNSVGVAVRRRLASGELGAVSAAGRGIASVTFLTVYRLAELLAAPALAAAGRRPVSTPVVAAAVRRALAAAPGMFAPVAQHPATEEAFVAVHRELSDLDDAQLDVLAGQHQRASEVVRIHRAVRGALAGEWYDEHDLMVHAAKVVAAGSPLVAQFGTVVCFLPQRWSAPAARLLGAVAESTDMSVVVALTGHERADAAVASALERIGVKPGALTTAFSPPAATYIFNAADPDDEVRTIVRGIVDAMRDGVPLERMAVLYGAPEPYARLVHEHLDAAAIAHNGASVRTLASSVLGHAFLSLLDLADHDFAREAVCGFMAAAPVLDGAGRRVDGVRWERLSRRAGVVRGAAEWSERLHAYAASLRDSEWAEREVARCDALARFVDALRDELQAGAGLHSWAALGKWAHRLVRRFLGDETRRQAWPAFELEAARRVEAAIDRLGTLDAVDTGATLDVFRRTLALELDAARDRVGRLGEGVLAGPVSIALGVDLERVWVCGLAEGVFPSVPNDDPLLSDAERASLAGELRLRSERVDDDHRAFLAALASTAGERVCSYARGDLRRTTEHVVSRFIAPTLGSGGVQVHEIASYAQGVARASFPATEHELAVQAALHDESWVAELPPVARGVALLSARAGDAFTRFDGNLAALGDRLARISPVAGGRAISASRLEQWAACPHGYFVHYVLHIEGVERPEEVLQISPIDRGSLVHEILDRFLDEVRDRDSAGAPWTDADRARLRAIAEESCAAAQARGVTGRRLLWERDRRVILAELDAFLRADERYRDGRDGVRTLATELAFGLGGGGADAVEAPLNDGRTIRLRGQADRIDRATDGTLVVVDYKTGSFNAYTQLSRENAVDCGTRLQLPIYARAARAVYGVEGDAGVEALYWFVGRGENRQIGYAVDADVDAQFTDALSTIVGGIEHGLFVAHPAAPGPRVFVDCEACDPDGLGTADRWREWERKYDAPELAPYRRLYGAEE